MKKAVIDAILVVEGKTDSDFIGTFLDCDVVTTNGSAVPRETIDFLKEAASRRKIIVLTDPDYPGTRIRNIIAREIPGILEAFVPKERCIKGGKVGVAESDPETVMDALAHLLPAGSEAPRGAITVSDLTSLGLIGSPDSSALREKIARKFHLGHTNGKSFLRRINALGITLKELEDECR